MNDRLPWIQTHPVGRIAVMLVWHLATTSVIIRIKPCCQLHFQKIQSPPYVNSLVLLMERASAPIRLDAWVCIDTIACSVD
jgi:hypothetical protein